MNEFEKLTPVRLIPSEIEPTCRHLIILAQDDYVRRLRERDRVIKDGWYGDSCENPMPVNAMQCYIEAARIVAVTKLCSQVAVTKCINHKNEHKFANAEEWDFETQTEIPYIIVHEHDKDGSTYDTE